MSIASLAGWRGVAAVCLAATLLVAAGCGQAPVPQFGLNMEGFWVVVSFLFIVGGLWTLFDAQVALVPLLLIVAGLAVLVSAFWGKPRTEGESSH